MIIDTNIFLIHGESSLVVSVHGGYQRKFGAESHCNLQKGKVGSNSYYSGGVGVLWVHISHS